MADFLSRILEAKAKEIPDLAHFLSAGVGEMRKTRSLTGPLRETSGLEVIAEMKRASPSKGAINMKADPVIQAKAYERAGAAAVSVLTDSVFFKGSFADLKAVCNAVSVPVLCKDFILDEIQIMYARQCGASAVLLIAAALPPARLASLYRFAEGQGLEVLVEIHDEEELERMEITPALIGVNNRNLKTFETDLTVTERLSPLLISAGQLFISESGIRGGEDAARVYRAGASGVLAGESLMRAGDIHHAISVIRKGGTRDEGENMRLYNG